MDARVVFGHIPGVPSSPLELHSASPVDLQARLRADERGVPYLLFRDGDGVQRIVALDAGNERLTIGRSPTADVSLRWDAEVSRVHAALERMADGWTVVDDRLSRNGSFVNEERLQGRRLLDDRDILRFGKTNIAFRAPVAEVTTETVAALDQPARVELSPAQRRVLIELCRPFADGRPFAAPATNEEIAKELFLGVDAIKTHLRMLYQRFGLDDLPRAQKRVALAERAFATQTISAGDYQTTQAH